MLKLKLQYFGHLMRRADSLEKTLMLGKIEGGRRRGRQRMRWLDGVTDSMVMSWVNSGSWWWTGGPGVLRFMGSQRVGHDWATELNRRTNCCPLQWSTIQPYKRRIKLFMFGHESISQLLQVGENSTARQCVCLHMYIFFWKKKWWVKRDLYFSILNIQFCANWHFLSRHDSF